MLVGGAQKESIDRNLRDARRAKKYGSEADPISVSRGV